MNNKRVILRSVLLGLALLGIAGCETPYQRNFRGFISGGYMERRISDSAYVVEFHGNGQTRRERVWYLWLYRCAELTHEKGYELFTIRPPQGPRAALPKERVHGADKPESTGGLVQVSNRPQPIPVVYYSIVYEVTWHTRGTVLMSHAPLPEEVPWALDAKKVMDKLEYYAKAPVGTFPGLPDRQSIYDYAVVLHGATSPLSSAQPSL